MVNSPSSHQTDPGGGADSIKSSAPTAGSLTPFDRLKGWTVLFHVAFCLGLILLAARGFIFGNGFLLFQNWDWPIVLNGGTPSVLAVFNLHAWSSAGPDPSGFTRSATNFPPFLFWWTGNAEFLEKAYVVYAFVVQYLLAAIAAILLTRWLFQDLSFRAKRLVQFGFIFMAFVNPAALQWEAGVLVPFMWGGLLIAISLFATALALRSDGWKYAIAAGVSLSVGATQDPRLVVWGLGVIVVFLVVRVLAGLRAKVAIIHLGRLLLFAAPGILLALYAFSWAGGVSGAPLRAGSFGSIAQVSTNSSAANTLTLVGFYITGLFYAPPSVLGYQGSLSTLPTGGSPPFMVLPGGAVTGFWVASLWILPVLAFGSLLFKRFRAATVPMACTALISVAFAMGTSYPFAALVRAEADIGTIGFAGLGGIWQTIIGIPSFIEVVTSILFVTLSIVSLVSLYETLQRLRQGSRLRWGRRLGPATVVIEWRLPRQRKGSHNYAAWTVIAIVGISTLGSWQYFTGTFYPAGLSPGVSQSGVPNQGAYEPVMPPASDLRIMNYLAENPTNGTVYWPGPNSYAYPWNQKWSPPLSYESPIPITTLPGISYVVSNNLSAELLPLLQYFGVTRVVIDNMSSSALMYEFGVDSIGQVVGVFDAAEGVSCALCLPPDSWMFDVTQGDGLVRLGTALVEPLAAPESSLPPVLASLTPLGLRPVFAQSSASSTSTLTYGNPSQKLSNAATQVLTASNLSAVSTTDSLRGFPGAPNATVGLPLDQVGEQALPTPYSNWTVAVWSLGLGNASIQVNKGANVVESSPRTSSLISLNYLSSLVTGHVAGILADPSGLVTFNASVDVIGEPNSTGAADVNIVASNASAENIAQLNSGWSAVSVSSQRSLTVSGQLPLGTRYFTIRIFSNLTGSFLVSNISLRWTEVEPNPLSSSGFVVISRNSTFAFPLVSDINNVTLALQASGSGVVRACISVCASFPLNNSTRLNWIRFPFLQSFGATALRIQAVGEVAIGGLVYTSLAEGFDLAGAQINYSSVGESEIRGEINSGGGFILLAETYSPAWQVTIDSGSPSGGMVDQFGEVFFSLPAGSHSFEISLTGYAAQPALIVFWSATMIVSIALVARPAIGRRIWLWIGSRLTEVRERLHS